VQKYFFSEKNGKKIAVFLLTNFVYNVFLIVKILVFSD